MKKKLLFILTFTFALFLTLVNGMTANAAITISDSTMDFSGTTYKKITITTGAGYDLEAESNGYLVDYDGDVEMKFNKGLYLIGQDSSYQLDLTADSQIEDRDGTAISTAHDGYTVANLVIEDYDATTLALDLSNKYYSIIYVESSSYLNLIFSDVRYLERFEIYKLIDTEAADLSGISAVKVSSSSTNSFSESIDETRQYNYEYITELTFATGIYYFKNAAGEAITSFNLSDDVLGEIVSPTGGSYYGGGHIDYYTYEQIENLNNDIGLCEGFFYVPESFKLAFVTNTSYPEIMQLSWDYYELRDSVAPSISGTNYFIVNVNNMLNMDTILQNVFATDNLDGEVEVVCEETTYNPSQPQLGEFTALLSATDAAGNSTTATITIKVVDTEVPTLTGTTSYEQSYSSKLDLSVIESNINVSDNFDTDLTLTIASDTYSANYNVVGIYKVVYECSDVSGNSSSITVTVTVIDDLAPVITLPKSIELGTTSNFSLENFKSNITVKDDYDGTITSYSIVGFENYLNNAKVPGTYTITISASDAAGNKTSVVTSIIVRDTTNPEIWLNPYFVALKRGESLTLDQIKEYAAAALNISEASIVKVDGTWDTETEGQYALVLTLDDGEKVDFLVVVGDASDSSTNLFTNFFSKDYWNKLCKEWKTGSSWTNVSEYNILHWATIVAATIVVLGVIVLIIKKR